MQSVNRQVFIATDGREFKSQVDCLRYEGELRGKHFMCPACQGKGETLTQIVKDRIVDQEATAQMGWFAQPVFKDIEYLELEPCKACEGYGFTAKKLEPITETKIVGYK